MTKDTEQVPPADTTAWDVKVRHPMSPSLNDVRCEALFTSALQRSNDPPAHDVAAAIARSVREHGSRGCAALMAQEFGDHPEAASTRMRWVREVVARLFPAATIGVAASRANPFAAVAGRAVPVSVRPAA